MYAYDKIIEKVVGGKRAPTLAINSFPTLSLFLHFLFFLFLFIFILFFLFFLLSVPLVPSSSLPVPVLG